MSLTGTLRIALVRITFHGWLNYQNRCGFKMTSCSYTEPRAVMFHTSQKRWRHLASDKLLLPKYEIEQERRLRP